MSKRCKAKTKRGQPCGAAAGRSGYCAFHDPAHGKARAEGRKRGGQNRTTPHAGDESKLPAEVRSVPDVMAILDYTMRELLPQDNGIARARVLVSLALAYLRALDVGELEGRLEAIEQALKIGATNEQASGKS